MPLLARLAAALGMLVLTLLADAQPAGKVARIGFLMANSPAAIADRMAAFRDSLRQLGYAEGKNIVIEYRWAEGKMERLPGLAAELVRLKSDVIVTAGPTVTLAAKQASSVIPIVMAFDTDPVGSGFAASLARPGGNITGLSTLAPEISSKQLELLQEVVPKLDRVLVVGSSSQPGTAQALTALERAAAHLGIQIRYLSIESGKDIEAAFREAMKWRADAVLAVSSRVLIAHRTPIANAALKSNLPVIYAERGHVEQGGLMSYGVSYADLYRRAGIYVDKILKGARPGDLPIEQPTKFELLINMRTAKALRLTLPQSLLLRADQIIE
jgi:putative ABC transport system substrate-binding protein